MKNQNLSPGDVGSGYDYSIKMATAILKDLYEALKLKLAKRKMIIK